MQQSHREVIVLKPTSVFLSFLAAQAPDVDLPPLEVLQADATAYTILKQDGEEETLDEIERHFSSMFRYEIRRWLGDETTNPIEGSFLDFLCCFKFEMHSQILLMEPTIEQGKQLICIKPRSVLLKWIKSSAESQEDYCDLLERVTLTQLVENATVLVKNFQNQTQIHDLLKNQYFSLFKAEMERMSDKSEHWPLVDSFDAFHQYFSIQMHTQLVHLL